MKIIGIGKWLAVVAACALTACGGGGGGGSAPTPPPNGPAAVKVGGLVTASPTAYFGKVAASAQAGKAQAMRATSAAAAASAPQACPSGPDLNVDTDGDGVPDLNVDVDCDGIPDYTLIDGSKLALLGANVKLTNVRTREVTTFDTRAKGRFVAQIKTGIYDIEVTSPAADGAKIWGFAMGRAITSDADIGELALSRNPVIYQVAVDGTPSGDIMGPEFISLPSRKLKVGDAVDIHVTMGDPNNRPITARAFSHLGAGYTELPVTADSTGYTMHYVVAKTDAALSSLEFGIELNNDDGLTGADQYRDALVRVTYKMDGVRATPLLQGVTINGKAYDNATPSAGMYLTADPVLPGTPIAFTTRFDTTVAGGPASVTYWYDGGAPQQSNDASVVIPGSATNGVYYVKVTPVVYLASNQGAALYGTISIPVQTTDKPAQLAGVQVNGASPAGRVFKVGDRLTIKALGSDPQGLPIEYSFSILGGTTPETPWQSSDTIEHTVTKADVNGAFGVRVWVRNDDGRVLDGGTPFDASTTVLLTASE